jgi:hypothetical protein
MGLRPATRRVSIAVLAASVVAAEEPPARPIAEFRAPVQADVRAMLTHLGPTASPRQRQMVDEALISEAPLTPEARGRAEEVHRVMRRRPLSAARLGPAQPLDVRFADYTIGQDGFVIPGSTGWTSAERQRFSRFLRRVLPIVRDVYGDPFRRWTITLVKDLQYSGTWIFIPSLLEIHTDGSWNPRLLVHEFIHAFRGTRTLTNDADWRYSPTLSGFEEGFAEGMAYMAMNAYADKYCTDVDCSAADIPSYPFWDSYLEWSYDFSNDSSLTSESFWSDAGGTLKSYERYLMAAAAVLRLETAISSFSRRFNQEYYARIRADASYRPSREAVIAIIETLSPVLDGMPSRDWVDRQRIFDNRYVYGKRTWTVNSSPSSTVEEGRVRWLHFVETFPDGSEWAQYIPDCPLVGDDGPYLYYRLHGTEGRVQLDPDGARRPGRSLALRMQTRSDPNDRVRGCNDVPRSFPITEIQVFPEEWGCRGLLVEPTCIPQPKEFGLYRLRTSWRNPHHGLAPGPPTYAMPYDAEQDTVVSTHWLLAGRMPPDYDRVRHRFVGGIEGGRNGTVTIAHSQRPGVVTARVSNGAFYTEVPTCWTWLPGDSCWIRPHAPWTQYLVTVPGTLTLRFEGDDGSRIEEQRTIVFGNDGRHEFLLGRPSPGRE